MILHALLQHFGLHLLALVIDKEPGSALAVPDQAMADDLHVVVLAKLHKAVGIVPEVGVLLGMYLLALHAVFGHDAVEVLLDDGNTLGILLVTLVHIDGHADGIVGEGIGKLRFYNLSGLWL